MSRPDDEGEGKCPHCKQISCVCAELAATFRADAERFAKQFDAAVTRRKRVNEELAKVAQRYPIPPELRENREQAARCAPGSGKRRRRSCR